LSKKYGDKAKHIAENIMKKSARMVAAEEKKVKKVFSCRSAQISRFTITKRVPRQVHYAIANKKEYCGGK
jgi:hypothetical protein